MRTTCILILLLLAACNSAGGGTSGGDFSAEDVAPDAVDRDVQAPVAASLSTQELADAAMLVNNLAQADTEQREFVLRELIALGPRYLDFLRSVDNPEVALDIMWVTRRIENDNRVARSPAPDEPPNAPPDAETEPPREPRKPPPEFSDNPGDFDREQVERFMAARLREARRLMDAGATEGAARIAEAALTLMPDTRYKPEFDKVLRDSRNQAQSELLIAGTMQLAPERLQYATREKNARFADNLLIRCFLKNVSANEVRLKLFGGPGRESLLSLDVTLEMLDYAGFAAKTVQGNVNLPITSGAESTILPGQTHAIEVPLESLNSLDADAPRAWALGRVTIGASLRVYEAADSTGRTIVLQAIRFDRRTALVFPAGFDLTEAGRSPINTVRALLVEGKAQEAFMAAQLVRPSQLRAMGDFLLGEDYDSEKLSGQNARRRALAVLLNTGANWDIQRWRQWWQQNRTRY